MTYVSGAQARWMRRCGALAAGSCRLSDEVTPSCAASRAFFTQTRIDRLIRMY